MICRAVICLCVCACVLTGKALSAYRRVQSALSCSGAHPDVVQVHHWRGSIQQLLPGCSIDYHIQPVQGKESPDVAIPLLKWLSISYFTHDEIFSEKTRHFTGRCTPLQHPLTWKWHFCDALNRFIQAQAFKAFEAYEAYIEVSWANPKMSSYQLYVYRHHFFCFLSVPVIWPLWKTIRYSESLRRAL